jgi:hypothetical protein
MSLLQSMSGDVATLAARPSLAGVPVLACESALEHNESPDRAVLRSSQRLASDTHAYGAGLLVLLESGVALALVSDVTGLPLSVVIPDSSSLTKPLSCRSKGDMLLVLSSILSGSLTLKSASPRSRRCW